MYKLDTIQNKIVKQSDLINKVKIWKFLEKDIVFTNGCFDLLHTGHIHVINESASLGNFLVIGLNSDESIKRLKGPHRPIQNEYARSLILASLTFVSSVVIFNEDTPLELIKTIKPNTITKCGDYNSNNIIGADFIKTYGGKIKIINYIEGNSTTLIESKVKNSHTKC
ncbi:MAG: adenylyltransferase/cytidyltransferase family protein [Solitalea-like symbiont of Acarus siro]